jgi:hypothetical protein
MRQQPQEFRSDIDLKALKDTSSLEEVILSVNNMTTFLAFFNRSLSLQSNFDGYIAENIVIPAASSLRIQHFLGVKPKWRIILRQVGNGVITDIPSDWDDKVISLYNNGAVQVTLTVFIARE